MKNGFKMVPKQRQQMQLKKKLLLLAGVTTIAGLVTAFIIFFNFTDVKDTMAASVKVQSGGFENGLGDWTGSGDGNWAITSLDNEIRSGSKAAQLTTQANKNGILANKKYELTAPSNGKNYITVMAYVLASHCKNGVAIGLNNSSSGAALKSEVFIADSTWQMVEATFPVENGEKYYPVLYGARGNSGPSIHLNFDDVVMYCSSSPVTDKITPAKPDNVKITPTFSSSTVPMQWTAGNDAGVGTDGSLILRANGIVTSSPDVLSQTVYLSGNILNKNWKVVYNGSSINSYTDRPDSSGNYTYLIYNKDIAYNYSAPLRIISMGTKSSNVNLPVAITSTDAFYVAPGSTTILPAGASLAIKNATVDGTLINNENITITTGGSLTVSSTGTYIHNAGSNGQGATIPAAIWADGSTCIVKGPSSPKTLNTALSGLNQAFYNFSWDCTSQTEASTLKNTIIKGNFEVKSTGSSALNLQDSVKIRGDFKQIGGNISYSGTNSYLVFDGTGNQNLDAQGGVRSGTINIAVNKSGGSVNLNSALSVNGKLALHKGKIALGNNDLILTATNAISSYSKNAFVVTNGSGFLRLQKIGNSSDVWFPVGSAEYSYTPAAIKNSGTADEFRVRVLDKVFDKYDENDLPAGAEIANNVVNKTWIINENVKGGSNVTVTTQWNSVDEAKAFDRSSAYILHFNDGKWIGSRQGIANGSGPYTVSRQGITSFSPFSVGGGGNIAPLPVDMVAFNAKSETPHNIRLDWVTASEENNDRFVIERSVDGQKWSQVGTVSGNGTTKQQQRYTYNDNTISNITAEAAYYRLKQIDFKGTFEFSETRKVNLGGAVAVAATEGKAWYNNSEDKVYAILRNSSAQVMKATMFNISGQVIGKQNVQPNSNDSKINFDMNGLAKGIYTLILEGGEKTRALKVVKN